MTWGDAVEEAIMVAARPAVAAPLPSAFPLSALSALAEMVLITIGGLACASSSDDSIAVLVWSWGWCSSARACGGGGVAVGEGAVSGWSSGGAVL